LTGNTLLDVAYVGAKGTHLPLQDYDLDYLTAQQLATYNTCLETQVPNPFYNKVPSTSPLDTPAIAQGTLLHPFPQYGNVQLANQGMADSSYNALQAKFEARFGGGGTLLASYTFSKLISDAESLTPWLENNWNAGFQNWGNLRGERSLATLMFRSAWWSAMCWIFLSAKARSICPTRGASPGPSFRAGASTES